MLVGAQLRVKNRAPGADNHEVTGFARRRSDRPATPRAEEDRGDPAAVAPLLAALAVWSALHAVVAPMALAGAALVTAVLIDLIGAAALSVPVLLARLRGPRPITLLLAAAGLLGAGRACAAGQPLSGIDAGVCLLVAALLLPVRHLAVVLVTTVAGWAGATGYAVVHELRVGEPGSLGPAGHWVYAVAVVTAAAAVAYAVRSALTARADGAGSERDQLAEHSVRDPLTGLANRAGIELVAAPMIEHARRSGQAVHCLYVDVDGMRTVNEAAGLAGGDAVLREVAEIVQASVRGTDVVARWTGDEFVVVGPGTGTSPLELERRVRARLVTHPPVPVEIWSGRVSIGSATLVPWDEGDLSALLAKGEQDMEMRRSLRRQSHDRLAGPQGPRAAGPTLRG
jgi:diguanylate cyclase (GGDEF)-like protein